MHTGCYTDGVAQGGKIAHDARRIARGLACSLAVSLVACTPAPETALVGTWQQVEGTEVVQFLDSGEVIQEDSGGSIGAAYRYIDDQHIRVDFGGPAVYAPPRTYRVELEEDRLALVDEDGTIKRYLRTEKAPTIKYD